jgi:hypothetical protein
MNLINYNKILSIVRKISFLISKKIKIKLLKFNKDTVNLMVKQVKIIVKFFS